VRVEEAGLGPDGHVRLVVSGVSDLPRLQRAWASSGAVLEAEGGRLRATTTPQALARAAGRALGGREAGALERALAAATDAWRRPAPPLALPGGRSLALGARPAVMGVVNVTGDSFSDGGLLYPRDHPAAGLAHGEALMAEGADLLDVGGESTRPGSDPVPADEELRRVLPVVEALAERGHPCSVDTTKPEVARAAVAAGAAVVNDTSGARDPALLEAVADTSAAYVLMHTRGTPRDMQQRTAYDDVVAEVYEFLADGLDRCAAAGVPADRVIVDPGIGFAKSAAGNLALLRSVQQLRGLGRPVLIGASRKSFLGLLTAEGDDGPPPPGDRLEAGLAIVALAVARGAAVLRVHDVRASVRVARVSRAVATGEQDWPPIARAGWAAGSRAPGG